MDTYIYLLTFVLFYCDYGKLDVLLVKYVLITIGGYWSMTNTVKQWVVHWDSRIGTN